MSVCVTRHIEVFVKQIETHRQFNSIEKFQSKLNELEVGKYYVVYDDSYRQNFYKVTENPETLERGFVLVDYDDIPSKWELVKWWSAGNRGYSSEYCDTFDTLTIEKTLLRLNDSFTDNACTLRDLYLTDNAEFDTNIADRGWPDDMSEELSKKLNKETSTWNHTYLTLHELYELKGKAMSLWKNNLKKSRMSRKLDGIDRKLDLLLVKTKDPFYEPNNEKERAKKYGYDEDCDYDGEVCGDSYEDDFDYYLEEKYHEVSAIQSEIIYVANLVEEMYGFLGEQNVRVIYYFS